MSFQDLEAGIVSPHRNYFNSKQKLPHQEPREQDPSQAVAAGIFRIRTAVLAFDRLVASLGTPKDTIELRDKLHKTRLHITQLIKETSAKLKQATETDHQADASPLRKIADAKLAKDFQSALKDFQKTQRHAAEKETTYAPSGPKEGLPSSYAAHVLEITSSRNTEHQTLLQSKRQTTIFVDNEITFNEAIIEEREQGIREIQQQIGEVNEIFKDLAILVQEQGVMIDDISSNIESSHNATTQGTSQLAKASKMQRSNSSMMCLLLVIFGIVLLIVTTVLLA